MTRICSRLAASSTCWRSSPSSSFSHSKTPSPEGNAAKMMPMGIRPPRQPWTQQQMTSFQREMARMEQLPHVAVTVSNISNFVFSSNDFSRYHNIRQSGGLLPAVLSYSSDGRAVVVPHNQPTDPSATFDRLFWSGHLGSVDNPSFFGVLRRSEWAQPDPATNVAVPPPGGGKQRGDEAEQRIKHNLQRQNVLISYQEDFRTSLRSTIRRGVGWLKQKVERRDPNLHVEVFLDFPHNLPSITFASSFQRHGWVEGYSFGNYRPDLVKVSLTGRIGSSDGKLVVTGSWHVVEIKYRQGLPASTIYPNWETQLFFCCALCLSLFADDLLTTLMRCQKTPRTSGLVLELPSPMKTWEATPDLSEEEVSTGADLLKCSSAATITPELIPQLLGRWIFT
ncbi:hypothetical protein T439DRAFT_83330 [Meredithblackwellia eburnea MCA 4105]